MNSATPPLVTPAGVRVRIKERTHDRPGREVRFMPVHDWTRVDAGTFHDFHCAWITHIKETLNGGLLPEGFYAQSEQHAGKRIADVLTLHHPVPETSIPPYQPLVARASGALAVEEAPPRVKRRLVPGPRSAYRLARRTLAVRHVSGHRVVALVEILSPGNKDRAANVADFVDKVDEALRLGVHVLLVDLFPPGLHDPQGVHGTLWERYDLEPYDLPADEPLTLASYRAGPAPEAFVDHFAVAAELPDMPLFLDPSAYIPLPLEPTYRRAYLGMPGFWKGVIEA